MDMNICHYCDLENKKMIKEKGYGLSYIPPQSRCPKHKYKLHPWGEQRIRDYAKTKLFY